MMIRTSLRLAVSLALLAGISNSVFAGVVTPGSNLFLQNAEPAGASVTSGSTTPPPAAPILPSAGAQTTPPPPMPPVPGAAATGFKPAATGYSAPPRKGNLPPPLPSATVAHNAAVSNATPHTVPLISAVPVTPEAQSPAYLRKGYIQGPNVVHTAAQHIVVGPHSLSNVVVELSGYAPNLFYTPFHHPNIIYTDAGAIHWTPFGRKAMVAIEARHPVGVILTGGHAGDPTINLTLVPQKTPGRTYVVDIPGWTPNPVSHSAPLPESARSLHFLAVLKAAALGQTPSGYTRTSHLPASQRKGQLQITPFARYLGSRHVLVEYRVQNTSSEPLVLSESDFYRPGVSAVSFWPSGKIQGNGTVRLFVLSHDTRHHAGMIGFVGKD